MSDKKNLPQNKCFFASSSNDRGLSLDDKTKDFVDRNTGGQVYSLHEVTQLGQYLRWKFAYLSGRTKKNNFSKTEMHFHKKKYTKIIRTYCILGYKNMKVGVKSNFGRGGGEGGTATLRLYISKTKYPNPEENTLNQVSGLI